MTAARLNVVFFLDSLNVGGTELNAVRVLERLDRSRYNPVVASFAGGKLSGRLDDAGIEQFRFPIGSFFGRGVITEGLRFAHFLRERRVDIVHSHDRFANPFAVPWARYARVRGVIASKRWGSARLHHAIGNRLAYKLAHRVLANSGAVGESLVREDGVPRRKVAVVTNFVDTDAFTPLSPSQRVALRAELRLPENALVVGMIARLSPAKDHVSLLAAVRALRVEFPTLILVLVGDGSTRPALERMVAEQGLGDAVRFAGMRLAPPNLNGLFDVSVLATFSEGFPNTVIEAMAAGRPVVASNVGGVPDAIHQGDNGLLVPPRDVVALTDALRTVLADAPLRHRMGVLGNEIARREFSAPAVMATLDALYRDLTVGTR